MPVMIRSNKKAQRIIDNLLGNPFKRKKPSRKKKIDEQLHANTGMFEQTTHIR